MEKNEKSFKENKMIYTAFLRGINVGGHHKLPMATLREQLTGMGCEHVQTLLNSGNVVFETKEKDLKVLESKMETQLTQAFNFPVPVIVRTKKELIDLVNQNPFESLTIHKDLRLYVTFIKEEPKIELKLPYISKDGAFQIISIADRMICSVLDVSTSKTTKGMDELEKLVGKNCTTRNWNTVVKMVNCD